MITISDNGSALALGASSAGREHPIDATLVKAGVGDFHWPSTTPRTTGHAAGIGTFFTLLAKRQLISGAASDRMLARLDASRSATVFPRSSPGSSSPTRPIS